LCTRGAISLTTGHADVAERFGDAQRRRARFGGLRRDPVAARH
jgi:hypothetical protein